MNSRSYAMQQWLNTVDFTHIAHWQAHLQSYGLTIESCDEDGKNWIDHFLIMGKSWLKQEHKLQTAWCPTTTMNWILQVTETYSPTPETQIKEQELLLLLQDLTNLERIRLPKFREEVSFVDYLPDPLINEQTWSDFFECVQRRGSALPVQEVTHLQRGWRLWELSSLELKRAMEERWNQFIWNTSLMGGKLFLQRAQKEKQHWHALQQIKHLNKTVQFFQGFFNHQPWTLLWEAVKWEAYRGASFFDPKTFHVPNVVQEWLTHAYAEEKKENCCHKTQLLLIFAHHLSHLFLPESQIFLEQQHLLTSSPHSTLISLKTRL